jgi:large repetitive protein
MNNLMREKGSATLKTKVMIIRYLAILIFSIHASFVFGQNIAQHNWYFGNSQNGIRFNRGNNQATAIADQFTPFGTGGSAVATNPSNGNLLFYTDGVNVYNACHLLMPNGGGLNGNPTLNQAAQVCLIPGQTNKYYIFTNSGGSIFRTTVDMSIAGSALPPFPILGDVEIASKNIPIAGLTNRSEGMIIVPNAAKTDFWLITHETSTSIYTATRVSDFFSITTAPLGSPAAIDVVVSNFSYNSKLKKLAVAVQNPNQNSLILNLDEATGNITFDSYIPNTGVATATTQSIYDIQWRNNSTSAFLYVSRVGEAGIPADVLQYNYANLSTTPVSILPASVTTIISKSFGLQLAPDSSIYHLYQSTGGDFLVEKFDNTDMAAPLVMASSPFGVIDFQGTQFPSFLPETNVVLNVAFKTAPDPAIPSVPPARLCQNNRITFLPDVTPNPDSVLWDFGDGTPTTKAWSPVHAFANANATGFQVRLTAFYQGQERSVTQPVIIDPFTLQLQLNQEETACECELPINLTKCGALTPKAFEVQVTASGGTPSYEWSNGDVGDILRPFEAGYYYVIAKDGSGCETYAGVNVKQYGLSDQRSNVWYFGDKAGIDFNPPTSLDPPQANAIATSAMTAPEGCAIVCDRNGDVIFYTNGRDVFDKNNISIANDLSGDPEAAQSSLIVPVPGDETLYYIFTTQAQDKFLTENELRYSIYDLKKNAVTQKNVLLFAKSTERITASGRWLIAHELGNNTFRSYEITANGIGKPVYSEIGSVHSIKSNLTGQGYMKFGPRDNLAVAFATDTENSIELFQLNTTTGVLFNYRKAVLSPFAGQIYGLEFSGRRLFATVTGPASSVFEFFLDDTDVLPPTFVRTTPAAGEVLGEMQLAPDGQIYIAVKDKGYLGTVQVNSGTMLPLVGSTFTFNGFPLSSGTTSLLGLPNFVQQQGNAIGAPGASIPDKGCVGQEVSFVGTPTDGNIDVFDWRYRDSNGIEVGSSSDAEPRHTFLTAGIYEIRMTLTNKCGLFFTTTGNIEIFDPPALPLSADLNKGLCDTPVTLDASAGIAIGRSYRWSNGDITPTTTLTQPGIGTVIISYTDPLLGGGCTSTANFAVIDVRPRLDLGPDQTICDNTVVAGLDAGAQDSYQWYLNGAIQPTETNSTIVVDTRNLVAPSPNVRTYRVDVTRVVTPTQTCTNSDEITFTINVSPAQPTISIITNPTCLAQNGSVRLTLNSSTPAGGPLYSYSITGTNLLDADDGRNSGFFKDFLNVGAGLINATVTDQISRCASTNTIGLSDATYTPTSAVVPGCEPLTVNITSNAPGGVSITSFSAIDPSQPPVNGTPPSNNFPISLNGGSYTIQLRDNLGCTAIVSPDPVVVTPNTPLTLTPIVDNVCASPPTLTTSGATTYVWTGPGIIGPATGPSIQINPGAGSFSYTVVGSTLGFCDDTRTLTILVPAQINPGFGKSNEKCAASVTLTATPDNADFTYLWIRDGVVDNTLAGRIVSIDQIGNYSFQSLIIDNVSGCRFTQTPAIPVSVSGTIIAELGNTRACKGDDPFTVSAIPLTAGATYAWEFKQVNTTAFSPISGSSNSVTGTIEGTYKVSITRGTCVLPLERLVIKDPLPEGKLKDRVIICDDPENGDENTKKVELYPGQFVSYSWSESVLGNLGNSDKITATKAGIYVVEISDGTCTNKDQTEVISECIPVIVGPNAFRPINAVDAINKDFFLYNFFIDKTVFEIAIFNRWGEIVFQSKDSKFKWNGGYGGDANQPLPGGTYAYVVKYQSYRKDGIKEKRGGVVLLR